MIAVFTPMSHLTLIRGHVVCAELGERLAAFNPFLSDFDASSPACLVFLQSPVARGRCSLKRPRALIRAGAHRPAWMSTGGCTDVPLSGPTGDFPSGKDLRGLDRTRRFTHVDCAVGEERHPRRRHSLSS